MDNVAPIDLKTNDIVQVSLETFGELLAGKKTTKKTAKKVAKKTGGRKAGDKNLNDYCFGCKSLTVNKGSVINAPYRLSKCADCNEDKKAFVNP